jgi:hypothetical protein
MRKLTALVVVSMLCLCAFSCGKGTEKDEKQFADFLTAARDWQEKMKSSIDNEQWNTVDSSRMEDVTNRGQPDAKIAVAQGQIIRLSAIVSIACIPCKQYASDPDLLRRDASLLKMFHEIQGRANKAFQAYVEAVDAYSRRDFEVVADKARLMQVERAAEPAARK